MENIAAPNKQESFKTKTVQTPQSISTNSPQKTSKSTTLDPLPAATAQTTSKPAYLQFVTQKERNLLNDIMGGVYDNQNSESESITGSEITSKLSNEQIYDAINAFKKISTGFTNILKSQGKTQETERHLQFLQNVKAALSKVVIENPNLSVNQLNINSLSNSYTLFLQNYSDVSPSRSTLIQQSKETPEIAVEQRQPKSDASELASPIPTRRKSDTPKQHKTFEATSTVVHQEGPIKPADAPEVGSELVSKSEVENPEVTKPGKLINSPKTGPSTQPPPPVSDEELPEVSSSSPQRERYSITVSSGDDGFDHDQEDVVPSPEFLGLINNFKKEYQAIDKKNNDLNTRLSNKKSAKYKEIKEKYSALWQEINKCMLPLKDYINNEEIPSIEICQKLVANLTTITAKQEYADEFAKHRRFWYKKVSPIIRGIIGAVVTFIIGLPFLGIPSVIALSNQKYKDTFFGLPKTTTTKDLEELKTSVNDLQDILKQMDPEPPAEEESSRLSIN